MQCFSNKCNIIGIAWTPVVRLVIIDSAAIVPVVLYGALIREGYGSLFTIDR